MKKNLFYFCTLLLLVFSCGKKSDLVFDESKKVKFRDSVEGYDINNDKGFKYYSGSKKYAAEKKLREKKLAAERNKELGIVEDESLSNENKNDPATILDVDKTKLINPARPKKVAPKKKSQQKSEENSNE